MALEFWILLLLLLLLLLNVIFIVYNALETRRNKEFDRRLDAIRAEADDVMMMADKGEITHDDAKARIESLRRQIKKVE